MFLSDFEKPSVLESSPEADHRSGSDPPLAPTASRVQFGQVPAYNASGMNSALPGRSGSYHASTARGFSLVGKSFKASSISAKLQTADLLSATSIISQAASVDSVPQTRDVLTGSHAPSSRSARQRSQVAALTHAAN